MRRTNKRPLIEAYKRGYRAGLKSINESQNDLDVIRYAFAGGFKDLLNAAIEDSWLLSKNLKELPEDVEELMRVLHLDWGDFIEFRDDRFDLYPDLYKICQGILDNIESQGVDFPYVMSIHTKENKALHKGAETAAAIFWDKFHSIKSMKIINQNYSRGEFIEELSYALSDFFYKEFSRYYYILQNHSKGYSVWDDE